MGRKVTAADIQVEIAKGAFRPHTALSNMALSYFQSDKNYFARTIFPMCPVSLSADNYYIFSKEDLLRDSWKRKAEDKLVLGERIFLIQGIDDPGSIGVCTITMSRKGWM